MTKKILIVEDDKTTLRLIQHILEKNQYIVLPAQYGSDAFEYIANKKIHGAILDLYLPDIDGIDILKKIRQHPILNNIPVLILTSNNDKLDTVLALEMGADDYITKPFNQRELVARLKASLRRSQQNSVAIDSKILIGDIKIDLENRTVKNEDTEIDLTFAEFELLSLLASNPGKVFTRDILLNKLWGESYTVETRIVDMHISSLRKKLKSCKHKSLIETVRGVGYRFIKFN